MCSYAVDAEHWMEKDLKQLLGDGLVGLHGNARARGVHLFAAL